MISLPAFVEPFEPCTLVFKCTESPVARILSIYHNMITPFSNRGPNVSIQLQHKCKHFTYEITKTCSNFGRTLCIHLKPHHAHQEAN